MKQLSLFTDVPQRDLGPFVGPDPVVADDVEVVRFVTAADADPHYRPCVITRAQMREEGA